MADIKKLRERSKIFQEIQDNKIQRFTDKWNEVTSSDSMKLTVMHRLGEEVNVSDDTVEKVADDMLESLVKTFTDPVLEFDDMCRARGYKPSKVRILVSNFARVWKIGVDGDYEATKQAVAAYLQQNPKLYEDFANYL